MSGIAGIYYLDGRPVDDEVDRMVETIEHRGPDGISTWQNNSVGLGHCMLETTPEDQFESLPLVDRTGNFAITADARIDNRRELIKKLEIRVPRERPITDAEIILAAYKKWGQSCPRELLGAFAFSVWDATEERLFCARDHFGVKPLVYHKSENSFLFGSCTKSVLTYEKENIRLNEKRISDYISNTFKNKKYTFYDGVKKIEPGSYISVTNKKLVKKRYYSLRIKENKMGEEKAFEKMRSLLLESVKARLRAKRKPFILLSGGLDSSSICAAANQVSSEVNTLSTIYGDYDQCDEREYIESVLNYGNYNHSVHEYKKNKHVSIIPEIIKYQKEPFYAPNISGTWERYKSIKNSTKVILDGHAGNEVVSPGYGRLVELARNGEWIKLYKNLWSGLNPLGVTRSIELFSGYIAKHGDKAVEDRGWKYSMGRKIARALVRLRSKVKSKSSSKIKWEDVIKSSFASRVNAEERRHEYRRGSPARALSESERHHKTLSGNLFSHTFDVNDRVSSAHGLERRYPFLHKPLVEFCLSLPANMKRRNGWGRFVLRKAMDGLLPEDVLWRRNQANFLPLLRDGLRSKRDTLSDLFDGDTFEWQSYIDRQTAETLVNRLSDENNKSLGSQELFLLWRLAVLGYWLEEESCAKVQET
ncbi:lasso peptide isopeptide bond-forming cyclase [Salinibacter sp.]|uniref:lasso peptide isopeptide bond-forming cyclase n=1 Tax=Salinibacter sp. TaxID=2065818 RepID=UPI0021E82A66|nr:lasso peptide isopeptide bond-forming cyclase [Salinibacter sp.]